MNFHFQLPSVLLEKRREKLVFMDRRDGCQHVWVIASVVRIVLDIISFRLLFLLLLIVLLLLCVAPLFDFLRYWCGE